MIQVAPLETHRKTPEKAEKPDEGQRNPDPSQKLFDSAHPHIGSISPSFKPGDPPTFLNMAPPNWGSFAQNTRAWSSPSGDAVRPTGSAVPEGDAAKAPNGGQPNGDAVRQTGAPDAASDAAKAQKANIDLLSNSKISSEDKLRAVDALYKAGTREVTLADGHQYSLRQGDLGSGHMVHLFSNGPDGKQHIVLRGVMSADGKNIGHEVGHTGKAVNLEGDWWSRHMEGKTPFAAGNAENFEFGNQPRRPLAFAPSEQPGADNGRPRPLAFKAGPEGDPNTINFDPNNKNPNGDASPLIRQQMAQRAYEYMQANPSTVGAGGYGNCSRIARQMFHDFGIKMDGMSGVHQGQFLESTGLFRRVSKDEAQPGDYCYRHWRSRPGDLGDSLVVTGRDQRGNVYGVSGAVKHPFQVNTHNGYYTPEVYLRPTAKYEEYMKQRGLLS